MRDLRHPFLVHAPRLSGPNACPSVGPSLTRPPPPPAQGCSRREGTSEAAPGAVRQAVGQAVAQAVGGGYCRLQMPLRLALGVDQPRVLSRPFRVQPPPDIAEALPFLVRPSTVTMRPKELAPKKNFSMAEEEVGPITYPPPPPPPRGDALEGGESPPPPPPPLQGTQPMPSHCPPDAECQPQCLLLGVGGASGGGGAGMHWKGGGPPPLQGAQPVPSHCPPDAKCQPQWLLQPTVTVPNRLPNRFWGRLWGPFPF